MNLISGLLSVILRVDHLAKKKERTRIKPSVALLIPNFFFRNDLMVFSIEIKFSK
jgi:hypothetical protein